MRDVDASDYFPTSRTLQRRFGGLMKIKQDMGIKEFDCRTGDVRKKMVKRINRRNDKIEGVLSQKLEEKYGIRNVRHPYSPYDDSKVNIDYLVFHPTENKAVGFEMFYPENRANFNGCLNIKKGKGQLLQEINGFETKFYYVVTNPDISQEEIDMWLTNKKNDVDADGVLSYDVFCNFDLV